MRSLTFMWTRKSWHAPLFIALGLTFPVAQTFSAQTSRAHRMSRRKAPASATSIHDCGQGITLRLSATKSTQGSLLLLEMRGGAKPLSEVKATWDNREIPFWQQLTLDDS
jgi:hypothetical protein